MDNCAKVHKKTATSNFYYLSLSKQVMLFLMMKKIFYTTSILFFLLLGGLYFASDFMFDYSLRPAKNRGRRVNYSYHRVRRVYPGINVWMEDRKSGVEGKSVDLGGRRIIKKKKKQHDKVERT